MLALVVNSRLHPRHAPPYAACSFLPSRFLPRSPFPTPSRLSHFSPSSTPFLSHKYELPILQVLCFDIHTKCPGCVPPNRQKEKNHDHSGPRDRSLEPRSPKPRRNRRSLAR